MTKTTIARFVAGAAGFSMLVGVAMPAGAQTIAELQAQISALMAQLASIQGGSTVTTNATFTQNLTLGSTGSEVVALQQVLVAQGHLTMPAGVAMGYFGPLTQAAVARWQAANGVSPAAGYWGPISRARYAVLAGGTTTGGTTTGGTTGGTISTPGVEGTLTATLAPSPTSGTTVREGDAKKAVLGLELEADLSDIRIERIKVKLDSTQNNDRDFYRDIADMIYVMQGSTVLASAELNSSTVIEETSGNFYVTLTGINYVVPKDGERTLTIAVDAMSNFDSDFTGDDWTVTVPTDGIRGTDGAGINQFAPSSGTIARTFESQPDQSEDATLAVSLSSNTPDATEVVAAAGSDEDELDELTLLRFDARAEDDDVTITDLVVDLVRTGSETATATTAYLYDGSTLVGSATVVDLGGTNSATFDDIEVTVNEDSTKTLTVKVDIEDATSAATVFSANIDTADVTAENAEGDDVTESGSASGESITVRSIGLEISLVGTPTITKSSTPESSNVSTSTAQANFTIRVKAVGGDIIFGTAGSTTVPFASNAGGSHDDDPSFVIYRGGSEVALSVNASSTSITTPNGVASVTNNSFTVQENNTVDIPVSFLFEARTAAGALVTTGLYAVGIQQLNWVSSAGIQASTFMDDETSWRTGTVTLP